MQGWEAKGQRCSGPSTYWRIHKGPVFGEAPLTDVKCSFHPSQSSELSTLLGKNFHLHHHLWRFSVSYFHCSRVRVVKMESVACVKGVDLHVMAGVVVSGHGWRLELLNQNSDHVDENENVDLQWNIHTRKHWPTGMWSDIKLDRAVYEGGGAYPTHQQWDCDRPFDYPPNSDVVRVVPAAVKTKKGTVRAACTGTRCDRAYLLSS